MVVDYVQKFFFQIYHCLCMGYSIFRYEDTNKRDYLNNMMLFIGTKIPRHPCKLHASILLFNASGSVTLCKNSET